MGRVAFSDDNALIESFWSMMQRELGDLSPTDYEALHTAPEIAA